MILNIKYTTDSKNLGKTFDSTDAFVLLDGCKFLLTNKIEVGEGYYQYSNSNYIILTQEVTDV